MIEVLERDIIANKEAIYTISEHMWDEEEDQQGEVENRIQLYITHHCGFNELVGRQDAWRILTNMFFDDSYGEMDVEDYENDIPDWINNFHRCPYIEKKEFLDLMTMVQLNYFFNSNKLIQANYIKQIFEVVKNTFKGHTVERIEKSIPSIKHSTTHFYDADGGNYTSIG